MNVSQAMQARRSVRAFLPQAPSPDEVQRLIADAAQAASGGNLQPWRVVALAGAPLGQLTHAIASAQPQDEDVPNQSYPPNLWEPYRSRRFKNGEDLYKTIGVPREDKAARLEQLAKNGRFFGAPVGVLVLADERMGYAQWVDLGIYLQSFMLLAAEKGLASCAQGFWRMYNDMLLEQLALPGGYQIAFGIALGYEDTSAPINQWRSSRATSGEWLALQGLD